MCGIDCAKQSVGRARSPKSDFGVAGCRGVRRKKILFVIRFAIVQSLAHNAASSKKKRFCSLRDMRELAR